MNQEQRAAIAALRHDGFAVIVWTPEELGDVNPRRVEDDSIAHGYTVIECLT